MQAMILAAGRGQRMAALTQAMPKPLLQVKGKALIEHQLDRLRLAGISKCIINLNYQGNLIKTHLGNGSRYGVDIHYSVETEDLETAGGIIQALPFFESKPFVLLSADVLCDYPLQNLSLSNGQLAHCVLVNNPSHHPDGDFAIGVDSLLSQNGEKFTYANQGIYHPRLFEPYSCGRRKLLEVLLGGIKQQQITGEHYQGMWINVDTPERLALAEASC